MSFANPRKAVHSLTKLAGLAVVIVVAVSCFVCSWNNFPPGAKVELLCVLMVLSLIAYWIRDKLAGCPRRQGAPRGAERTPLLPAVREEE